MPPEKISKITDATAGHVHPGWVGQHTGLLADDGSTPIRLPGAPPRPAFTPLTSTNVRLKKAQSLDLCEQVLRDEGWPGRSLSDGRVLGIGYSCFSERTGYGSGAFAARKMQVVPGFDLSQITMDLDGTVTVTTGTLSHGQSHETTFAQIVADRLGLPYDKVTIVQGDTDRITYGWGSFASRSVTIGGSAAAAAAVKLGDQLRALAAHLAGTDVDSARLDGRGGVRAGDRTFSYAELADVAYLRAHLLPKEVGPGLTATASFDVGGDGTFSNATHGCVVALDPGTGQGPGKVAR